MDGDVQIIVIGEDGYINSSNIQLNTSSEFNETVDIGEFSDQEVLVMIIHSGRDGVFGEGQFETGEKSTSSFVKFLSSLNKDSMDEAYHIIQNQVVGSDSDDLIVADKFQLRDIDEDLQRHLISDSLPSEVIVLGKYDDSELESELIDVRNKIRSHGYPANLIKSKSSTEYISLEEKVRAWTTLAPFCIIVDREASGHIKEFEILKQSRTITAMLRPEEEGSTWMIGDEPLVDYNYIKIFEFEDYPTERVADAVAWARCLIESRKKAYQKHYEFER
jgi:hypothetical protein